MDRFVDVLPHDLLWGMPVKGLPADAPDWVVYATNMEQPVVVRRGLVPDHQVAVGIRGPQREQRYAALMDRSWIGRCVRPEALIDAISQGDPSLPVWRGLQQARSLVAAQNLVWGIAGSAGYELASGVSAVHRDSDLDLILRTPEFFSREHARQLLVALDGLACRIDLQLQTPHGAVALREWAGSSRQVLLKAAAGAYLTDNPWLPMESAA